ncbi:MAG TPA: HlyD family secretion protein [Stellaceae bacterium]|nr:HlyD family secretion protein [Stellaceae bacterium]
MSLRDRSEAAPILAERSAASQQPGQYTGEAAARFRLRRFLLLTLLLLAAAAIIGGGIAWWLEARRWESTDDAFIDVHMVHVAPQVAGRVARVLVDDNQRVEAGQPILELDPADFQAKLDQAQANEAGAVGNVAQAKAQLRAAYASSDQARAEVGVADANATNAANQLKRDQPLAEQHVVSRQALDNDIAAARSTAASLVAAQKKLAWSEAQQLVMESQVATAEASLKSAAAQSEQARLNLSYTRLLAPLAGRIAHKNLAPGDYVQAGQDIMALVPAQVWITANFKETQLARMRVGQPVDIEIDAYPDVAFHGHVDSIQPGSGAAFSLLPPENATGNYVKVVQRVPVKIVFDDPPDPGRPLGPGMSVVPSVRVQ